MKIKEITQQSRRDYTAVMVCEHCNHEQKDRGYDDDNYHCNVIPNIKCEKCGKTAPSTYRPLATKYAANEVV